MKRLTAGVLLAPLIVILAACSSGTPEASREAGGLSTAADTPSISESPVTSDSSGSADETPEDSTANPSGPPEQAWLTKDTRLCIGNEGNPGFLLVPVAGTKGESVDTEELGTGVRCFESDNGTVGVSSMVRVLYDDGSDVMLSLHNEPFGRPDLIACRKAYTSALCDSYPDKEVVWTLSDRASLVGSAYGHQFGITRNPDTSFIEATVRIK